MSTINDDPSTQTDEFETGLVFNTGEAQAAPENILVPVYLVTQRSPTSCISSQPCNGFINYGVSYYWRVKVWEQQPGGLQVSSQWAYYKDTHTFDPHQFEQLITQHLGGHCPIVIGYRHDHIQTNIKLGKNWLVKPTDDLLTIIIEQLPIENVKYVY